MRKAIAGAAILLLLLLASLCNISYLSGFIGEVTAQVEEARALAAENKFASAAQRLQEAIEYWEAGDRYTHVFLRHSDVDSATDAFYELLSDLYEEDSGSAHGSFEALRHSLNNILLMERIRLGSIF